MLLTQVFTIGTVFVLTGFAVVLWQVANDEKMAARADLPFEKGERAGLSNNATYTGIILIGLGTVLALVGLVAP